METLVQLSQKRPDTTISVKLEFSEGEGQLSLKKRLQSAWKMSARKTVQRQRQQSGV